MKDNADSFWCRRNAWHRHRGVALLRRLRWGALPFAAVRDCSSADRCVATALCAPEETTLHCPTHLRFVPLHESQRKLAASPCNAVLVSTCHA